MDKLIYSIISVKPDEGNPGAKLIDITGIHGSVLAAVSFREVSVIAGEMDRSMMADTRSAAIEFAGVVEKLSKHFTLLPMRFGSFMAADESILQVVERNYNSIRENLLKVENKLEFGLKVFCDTAKVTEELQIKELSKPPDEAVKETTSSVFREYVNKKLQQHRAEELLLKHVESIISEVVLKLGQMNPVCKFKKMVSPSNIIDAVFLLEKDRNDGLIGAMKDLQKTYPAFQFILTGPWPPYSFVDITLK